ncbi:hypothetical protein POM88_021356 [Heracleum sosnowskyi]|uniref:BED-type domain-containing protein n=1 Tax=Heracleum sosnowskyi TaxID=360622 RepID=A0AAD8IEP3_9APIA|nr:hypothetical protein POM88_021356 [Heracleum sosnowskyi]
MENFNNLKTPNNIPNPIPVPNTTPNTAPNTTPVETKIEGDDDPLTLKKKPTRTSDVWDFFTKVLPLNPIDPRCTCNYCGADYACHSQRVGTSSFWVHLVTFNKVKCQNALDKFVVKDEQNFNVVEGNGFRELIQELQPKYKMGYLKYCFDSVYDAEMVAKLVVKVDSILQKMFSSYNLEGDDDSSKMARDVLAIPVSTVASESTFSTSGRILDSFRSSLSPKMLEALVCTQSWLKEGCACIKSREHLDEAEYYKFLEEDAGKDKKKSVSNDPIINIDE